MLIGICDDSEKDQKEIYSLCEDVFINETMEHKYIFFSSGEEVLQYCSNLENEKISLLFLDVEMNGISGIELKDAITREDIIWRIAFVTSHIESIYSAFSQKTIGFIPKPAEKDKVRKVIEIVIEDIKRDVVVTFKGYKGEEINVLIEDICYFEACGSYTRLFTYSNAKDQSYLMIAKKIGDIEKEMNSLSFVRTHKSYLVNLMHVIDLKSSVILKDIEREIPVGRVYKEETRKQYLLYGKEKIKKRL